MVYNLLSKLKEEQSLKIIALSLNEGILAGKLRDAGIETYVISETNNSFVKILLKTFKLLKKRRIDIIHSHRYKENLLAFLLAKAIGVKRLITTMHGLSEPLSTLASTLTYERNANKPVSLKTKIDYYMLNNYFTKVVAVSKEMKNTLIQKNGFKEEKVEVIYNGIPLPKNLNLNLSLNLKSNGSFHIGTVGRMVPVKDFNLFLEIAAEIKKQVNNIRFSILGDGPLKEQLTEKVKELNMQNIIEFISPMPDPMPYYQSLDLYLNTSLHEGIPLSILEAMSCGRPVVAPKVGGIPEIIANEQHGLLIESRNHKNFTDACMKLIANEGLRRLMGVNSYRRIATHFCRLKMAESYKVLYSYTSVLSHN